jgi:hypothetical protein
MQQTNLQQPFNHHLSRQKPNKTSHAFGQERRSTNRISKDPQQDRRRIEKGEKARKGKFQRHTIHVILLVPYSVLLDSTLFPPSVSRHGLERPSASAVGGSEGQHTIICSGSSRIFECVGECMRHEEDGLDLLIKCVV